MFTLSDLSGKQMMTMKDITDDRIMLSMGGLRNGVYIFTIAYDGEIKTRGKVVLLP